MSKQKEMATSFLKMAASGDVQNAYDRFVTPQFLHHNQYFKGDRESLKQAMIDAHQASPNRSLEVKRIYEDGDTVITHSEVLRQDPSLQPIAVVHIFRFSSGQIVELWDLGQEVMKDSPNENGPF